MPPKKNIKGRLHGFPGSWDPLNPHPGDQRADRELDKEGADYEVGSEDAGTAAPGGSEDAGTAAPGGSEDAGTAAPGGSEDAGTAAPGGSEDAGMAACYIAD